MIGPYLVMVALLLSLAFLAAVDAALASMGWLAWFNGLNWLRVHFITIGVLLEVAFAVLPFLAARRSQETVAVRWDIWLALNTPAAVNWHPSNQSDATN